MPLAVPPASGASKPPSLSGISAKAGDDGTLAAAGEDAKREVAPRLLGFWRFFRAEAAHAARQALSGELAAASVVQKCPIHTHT